MNGFLKRAQIELTRQRYPPGTRVELVQMNDDPQPVPPGTQGTVVDVDGIGQLVMKWDNGRTLSLVPGVDLFRKLPEQTMNMGGIYDNTIILFFSDHGDYTTDFGIVEKAQNCFPDCLTNVPLIIKPQKGIPVDCGVNSNLAELNDICATVCDLADVEIKRSHFSKSLVPALRDKTLAHRDFVCCEGGRLIGESHCSEYNAEHFNPKDHYAPRQLLQAKEDGTHTKAVMIRTRQYKYVYRLEERDEFYDLALGERRNLIDEAQYADEVERLKSALLRWMVETCDVVPLREDDRFPPEFIQNSITGITGSPLMGRLVAAFMKFTGKSVNDLRKMVGK